MSTVPIPQGATVGDAPQAQSIPIPQGATVGDAEPSALSRFGHSFLSGLGVTSDEDAKKFFEHPIRTAINMAKGQGELAVKAKDAYNRGDYKGAVMYGLNYLVPLIGQQTAQAGEQLSQGDIAGGVGRTLGVAAPLAAGSPEVRAAASDAVKTGASKAALLGRTPEEAYQSALKPSTTIPPAKVSNMVQTGLKEGIPVSSAGAEKLASLIEDVNDKIKAQIDAGSNKGVTVDPAKVAARADQVTGKFATQVNPDADLQAVQSAKQEFLKNNPGPISVSDAQAMKQGTYRALGNKAYGELKGASIEAQKALARGLKEEIANAFPEIQQLNAQDSRLLDLQPILEKAVQRQSNHQMLGIGTPIAAGATKAVTGSGSLAAVTGLLKAVIDNPVVKSRLAIALNRTGVPLPTAVSRIASYSTALGASSANDVHRADQSNAQ